VPRLAAPRRASPRLAAPRPTVPVTDFSTGYARDYHMANDEPQYIEFDHGARLGRFIHDLMMAIENRRDRPAISGNDPTMPRWR